MLQGLTRFLLDKIINDYKTMSPTPAAMEQVSTHTSLVSRTSLNITDPGDQCYKFDKMHELSKRVHEARDVLCERPPLSLDCESKRAP